MADEGDEGGEAAWPASPLWDYAVALYAAPGVAEACLALQDRRGADVNLLLLACWLGSTGRDPGPERLAEARALAGAWQEGLVRPVRAARRRLKAELARLAGPLHGPLTATRARLAEAELALERGQLALLEGIASPATAGDAPPGPALAERIVRQFVTFDREKIPELGGLLAAAFPGCEDASKLRSRQPSGD